MQYSTGYKKNNLGHQGDDNTVKNQLVTSQQQNELPNDKTKEET